MEDCLVDDSILEDIVWVTSGFWVVEIAVRELIILSIIETGDSDVLIWDADSLEEENTFSQVYLKQNAKFYQGFC